MKVHVNWEATSYAQSLLSLNKGVVNPLDRAVPGEIGPSKPKIAFKIDLILVNLRRLPQL